MKTNALNGRTALVTGASSGLGVDFAHLLAARGCHLVLVARREDRLRALADAIRAQHGVTVEVIAADLARAEAAETLHATLRERNIAIDVLVNNAGLGIYGNFVDVPWERERGMLDLDILTLVHLTKLFARDMVSRGRGWILQVASIGAFQPSPTYASYSAAKSYVLHFGEALNYELRGTGVNVSVLAPGITKTEFLEVAGQKATLYQRLAMMESRPVAEAGIRGMLRNRPSVVPGLMNKLTVWSLRLLPRRLYAPLVYQLMKSSLLDRASVTWPTQRSPAGPLYRPSAGYP